MTVRFGIVGFGNIGQTHAQTLLSGSVPGAELTAVVSSRDDIELAPGIGVYADIDAMIAAQVVDAVIVATPTMDHVTTAEKVFAANLHLVIEKPVAMSVGQVESLIAKQPANCVAAVMLNQRYHPVYRRIQNLIADGELGRLQRFSWQMTAWYRPDVYFQVSSWRGTWPGEGGGALVNQCIHNIDVMQWILGMPDALVADAKFGKTHDIEVEYEVSALLRYDSGLSGSMIASTGEAPGVNRLDIVGDLGSIVFDGETLTLLRAHENVSEHLKNTREMFGVPAFRAETLEVDDDVNQHACVLQDVVLAISDSQALATPLAAGVDSIALANAMLLSTWQRSWVDLPLDTQLYEAELAKRVAESDLRTPKEIEVHIDMEDSYR